MTDPRTTRGARKLAAALDAFALSERIRGAAAIDVGASTGGFTATLLAHGAREVTAFDVGQGQLAPGLRRDPRVRVHEQTDFRRAPLALAEGPFDFFTVDVSFMAARNVLRALAFRLREGAEGVVLLKPQFELPKGEVHRGDVSDPQLRRRALARFRARAEKLGFAILAQRDSDVAGGSGTIEIPLHLRFAGRPATLPHKGEKRAGHEPRPPQRRERALPERWTWFAVAAPGLEPVIANELRAIPACTAVREVAGGVQFEGEPVAGYAANLQLRAATRVLVRAGEVRAREFAELRRRLARLPFELFLDGTLPVRVQASARRCRLYHTKALAQTLALAAGDRIGAPLTLAEPAPDDDGTAEVHSTLPFGREPFARLFVRGEQDRFTVSVDSSGSLLHRRGARVETGRAPLRETLAAALLELAGYDGTEPLVNAMCGAGTIALEAVDIALARAPGRMRSFAFETFPGFDAEGFAALRAAAQSAERGELRAPIQAFDRDPAALEVARRNAERSGAAHHVQWSRADIREFAPPAQPSLLIANPPYGQRLGRARDMYALYRSIGARLREAWAGHRVALLVPRAVSAELFGLRRATSVPLQNGGLPVKLLIAEIRESARVRGSSRTSQR